MSMNDPEATFPKLPEQSENNPRSSAHLTDQQIAAARSEKTGWPAALREAQRLRRLLREYKESTTSLAENWHRRDPATILAELFAALEDET